MNNEAADAVEKAFVFTMIWSMGSALTTTDDGTDNRKVFSDWWRSEWKGVKLVFFFSFFFFLPFLLFFLKEQINNFFLFLFLQKPSQYTIFDYWYDPDNNTFELWSKSPFLSPDMMVYYNLMICENLHRIIMFLK